MFEPFHPKLVTGMEEFSFNQYMNPYCTDSRLARTMLSVFSGKFHNERVDSRNFRLIFYKGMLIKDIFSNLLIAWVARNLPHVKTIFLIRNPFAVASSKLRGKSSIWMTEPTDFLKQNALIKDHLESFQDILNRTDYDYIEKQILIWAIIHYVPFKQLCKGQVHIVFYEELYTKPEQELLRIFSYPYGEEGSFLENELLDKIGVPSRVSGKLTNIVSGKSPISSWKEELTTLQIDRGVDILRSFGLEQIYGTEFMPNQSVVEKLIVSEKSIKQGNSEDFF